MLNFYDVADAMVDEDEGRWSTNNHSDDFITSTCHFHGTKVGHSHTVKGMSDVGNGQ